MANQSSGSIQDFIFPYWEMRRLCIHCYNHFLPELFLLISVTLLSYFSQFSNYSPGWSFSFNPVIDDLPQTIFVPPPLFMFFLVNILRVIFFYFLCSFAFPIHFLFWPLLFQAYLAIAILASSQSSFLLFDLFNNIFHSN